MSIEGGEHPNVRRAVERQRKWLIETDDKPNTPERRRELAELARKTATRHERSGRSNYRGNE